MPKKSPAAIAARQEEPKYSESDLAHIEFFKRRKTQLMEARKNHFGQDIEARWRLADKDYEPHLLGEGRDNSKKLVENERTEVSRFVNLEQDEWRSKVAGNNPYIKIQSALSIILDRIPEAVFNPESRQYEATSRLLEALYKRTWADNKLQTELQWRKFIFNLSKYGWSVGRRFHRKEVREVDHIVSYDTLSGQYETQKGLITDFNDVFFENLSPWSTWVDETARPDDSLSVKDWMWKRTYTWEEFQATPLAQFPAARSVTPKGGSESGEEEGKGTHERQYSGDQYVDVYFYENRPKDLFIVEMNGKFVVTPLPYEHKQLSLVHTYWTLRSAESIYGIGVHEALKHDNTLYAQVKNMTLDQLVLSIYKMFFYQDAEQLDDEGETVAIRPGRGKKVIDPKNITTLDIPGPGKDAWLGLDVLEGEMEKATGISPTLTGEVTGKTAFEVARARESALRRLAIPFKNIKSAMEWDAMLCVKLMQQVYSVATVKRMTEPDQIANYIQEVAADPSRYFTGEDGQFNSVSFREFQLALEQDETGAFSPSENKQFFMVKPEWLNWEGTISIKMDSLVVQSQELEKENILNIFNIIMPLVTNPSINPKLLEKPIKQLLKPYGEDVKDWLPDGYFEGMVPAMNPVAMMPPGMPPEDGLAPSPESQAQDSPLIVPKGQTAAPNPVQRNSQILASPQPT